MKSRDCVDCNKEIIAVKFNKSVSETRCRSCGQSRSWAKRNQSGINHYNWKGGEKNVKGYIYVLFPKHKHANVNGSVQRSHLIWEQFTGYYPQNHEVIHHVDGNKLNDVIENLRIMTRSEHSRMHNTGNNYGYKHGRYVGLNKKVCS
jgi:hypothetical protein